MAFYDVSELYDTLPAPNYDDRRFTPAGKKVWGSERYNAKVQLIAAVVDSLALPLVVLFGIENEGVAGDVAFCLKQSYNYLHRDMEYYDGLDYLLFYDGSIVTIDQVRTAYAYQYIDCSYIGGVVPFTISLYLCRNGRRIPLVRPETGDITLVWGAITSKEIRRYGLDDISPKVGALDLDLNLYSEGRQRRANRLAREPRDGIRTSAITYLRSWLLAKDKQRPLATFRSDNIYEGGYSSRLPTMLMVEW